MIISYHAYAHSTLIDVTSLGKAPKTSSPKSHTMPAWTRAEAFDKLAEAYIGIEQLGGKVFTLRLRGDIHDRVVEAHDPSRLMSRRIQREFKRRGLRVPLHAFSLEVTSDQRNELHLHGAICLGDLPVVEVKDALRAAAGRISGRRGSRQIQIKKFEPDLRGPAGWAKYTKPTARLTRNVIKHNRVTYIHSTLRRLCAEHWEQRRGQHRELH